jgi:hypothetical protein
VFDPAKDEMFYAEKGAGAWLNDSQRLRVSGRTSMIECVFATGVPFGGAKYLPATLQDLARLMPQVAGVRRWGSAALDLAYVAAGRYDGYWERGLQPGTSPPVSCWCARRRRGGRTFRAEPIFARRTVPRPEAKAAMGSAKKGRRGRCAIFPSR